MSTPSESAQFTPKFPPLNESNYHSWKYDIQALLQRNGTWGVVSGRQERPETAGILQDTWDTKCDNAAGTIYSQVEPKVQTLIREHLDSAPDMWAKLKTLYAQDNAALRFLILDQFLSISKSEDESLTALCARVDDSLQQVRAARSDKMELVKFEEELAMMALIRSLPEEFSTFRSSLLLVPGELSLQKVKEAFLQEERNRQPRVSEQIAMKAATSSSTQKRRSGRSNRVCTHPTCKNKSGHTTENCFQRAREIARRADEFEARQKGKDKAQIANTPSGADEEAAAFAGNASTSIDHSHPCSPLILDAATDWNADTGATRHMTPLSGDRLARDNPT